MTGVSRWFISFALLFFVCSLLSGIAERQGMIGSTRLTASLSTTATTMTVDNTDGFLAHDYVIVGNETIRYAGKTDTTFTGLTRGYDGTTASNHTNGSSVYTTQTSVLNSILGFNVASTGASVGNINMITFGWNVATQSIPRLIAWDFAFLREGWMQYVRLIFLIISGGLVLTFGLTLLSALGGVGQSIFRR